MASLTEQQRLVCQRFSADFIPRKKDSKVGIALPTIKHAPLNALRLIPEGDTCSPNFFQPLHIEHLSKYAPNLLPYLGLAPGWRVLLATDIEDVWYDNDLLKTKNNSQ